jgi:diadenosine tetraphosphatase ApaH/serine/threonine PP2A family protein phosphatase
MRLALLADVHANLAALEAVVHDLREGAIDRVIVAGDLIGYHAEAAECVALLQEIDATVIAGNHDREVTHAPTDSGTHAAARVALAHARSALRPEQIDWLARLPTRRVLDEIVVVHGCFLNETGVHGYVTDTMLPRNLEVIASRPEWPRLGACGHTHVPMVGWLLADDVVVQPPARGEVSLPRAPRAVLLNPGAVGQPRDGDPRASYAWVDTRTQCVSFRRVEYDVERTCAAVRAAGLPEALALRLREGR